MFCLHQDLAHITVDGQDMDSAGAARWVNGDILIQPVSPPCPGGFPGMNFVGFLPWRWGGGMAGNRKTCNDQQGTEMSRKVYILYICIDICRQ